MSGNTAITWTEGRFTVIGEDDRRHEVAGLIWGIDQRDGGPCWLLTHLPTGYHLGNFRSPEAVSAFLVRAVRLADWDAMPAATIPHGPLRTRLERARDMANEAV